MFEFGRELRRIFRNTGRVETDSSLYELMNLKLLITQGRGMDVEAGRVSTKDRFTPSIEAAQVWREYARRTGDAAALSRAATAAESAGREAASVEEASAAAMEQAETCVLSHELFGTDELIRSAEKLVAECRAGVGHNENLKVRLGRVEARVAARLAMSAGIEGDLDLALMAMSHIDRAIDLADTRARQTGAAAEKLEAARMRFERADILLAVGLDRGDATLMDAVIRDFIALKVRLDPAYEPVTFGRVVLRLAIAHIYKGQVEGRPEVISEGIALLNDEDNLIGFEHSPLDWVEQKQAVALGLQALGELVTNEEIFDKAQAVYDLALKRPLTPGLRLRAVMLNNRAHCQVKRGEARGDLNALDAAERALKADIRQVKAQDDPVAWAVLQLNLARAYVVRGDLTGFMLERAEAAYAVEAAAEIFAEHGLSALEAASRVVLGRVTASVAE